MPRTSIALTSVILACFHAAAPTARAQTAEGGDAILILDASGSMWGVVDGQSKIAAARQAVSAILAKWKPSDRLGIMAYGHRSKGDCGDIQMIRPVGPVDAAQVNASIRALNPRGRTPLTESLRQAARELRATENKATVILVSDGVETCNADPCAAAAALKKEGVNFVAHVIGLDVSDPLAKSQLQCIARNTGGVYLDAANASGLQSALGKAIDATQGRKVASEAPAKPPAAAADPFIGKTLRATARLAEGLDPLTEQDLTWMLYKPGSDGEEKGEYVRTELGARLAAAVEPGEYVLEVSIDQTRRLFPVAVVKGKIASYDFVLDAGYVTSEGDVAGSGAKVENVAWEVRQNDSMLTTKYDPVPKFILPAGDYVMRLSKGSALATRNFTLAPGDVVNLAMTLDAGRLLVDALYAPGGPKVENGLAFEVRKPPRAENEEGEWVATIYDVLSVFDLPSGPYDLRTSVGHASKTQRIEIKSGQPSRMTVNLDAGVLAIEAPGADSIAIVSPKKDITGNRRMFVTFYEAQINEAFPAGDYVAIVTRGETKTEKPVKVVAGERTETTVDP